MNIVFCVYFFFVHTILNFSRFTQERSMPFKAQLSRFYIEKTAVEACFAIISKLIKCKNDDILSQHGSMSWVQLRRAYFPNCLLKS